MDKLAILRTVNHGSGDHTKSNHWMLTGFEGPAFNAPDFRTQRRPSMGSAVSHLSSGRRTGMPPYVAVPHLRGGTDNFFHYAAYLGGGANPFITEADPNKPDFRVRNLALTGGMSLPRLEDRRQLLSTLDNLRQTSEHRVLDLDEHRQGAFDLLTSPAVARAFDIASESDRVRDQYGRHTFGQSALLARRLVEAGVPFVTVNCVPWDHHGTGGNLPTVEGAKLVIPPFDQALAALIEDLVQRGLYERTLVVAMGEFGRTPRMNANAGRDHWGKTFSVLMGCGSMRMGQVIGSTNARGEHPVDRSVSPQDVTATVFHHLGIDATQVMFHDVARQAAATRRIGAADPGTAALRSANEEVDGHVQSAEEACLPALCALLLGFGGPEAFARSSRLSLTTDVGAKPKGKAVMRIAACQAKRRSIDWRLKKPADVLAAVDKNLDELEKIVHKAGDAQVRRAGTCRRTRSACSTGAA